MDLKNYLTAQNLIATVALYGAVLSTYGAILSTFNFIREQRKEKLKIKISSDTRFDYSRGHKNAYVVKILNQSSFKIQVLSAGFAVFSDPNSKKPSFFISPNNQANEAINLPAEIEAKMLFQYPIEADIINDSLIQVRLVGRTKIQPFAEINDKKFFGKLLHFDAISP